MKKKYLIGVALFVAIICFITIYVKRENAVLKANLSVNVFRSPTLPEGWGDPISLSDPLYFLENTTGIENAYIEIHNESIHSIGITNENGHYLFEEEFNAGQYLVKVNVGSIGEAENSINVHGSERAGANVGIVDILYVESENKWYWGYVESKPL